jgi:hypothetical protein
MVHDALHIVMVPLLSCIRWLLIPNISPFEQLTEIYNTIEHTRGWLGGFFTVYSRWVCQERKEFLHCVPMLRCELNWLI